MTFKQIWMLHKTHMIVRLQTTPQHLPLMFNKTISFYKCPLILCSLLLGIIIFLHAAEGEDAIPQSVTQVLPIAVSSKVSGSIWTIEFRNVSKERIWLNRPDPNNLLLRTTFFRLLDNGQIKLETFRKLPSFSSERPSQKYQEILKKLNVSPNIVQLEPKGEFTLTVDLSAILKLNEEKLKDYANGMMSLKVEFQHLLIIPSSKEALKLFETRFFSDKIEFSDGSWKKCK